MDASLISIFLLVFVFVVIIPITINIVVKKKKLTQKDNTISGSGISQQNGEGNTSINVGSITNNYASSYKQQNEPDGNELSVDQIKNELKVMFVDDKKFNVVDLLKKSGWKQVLYKRDILDIDSLEIREAHVIFLDINGVGLAMGFHNQGMGLCGALKRKYGDRKRVVLYSGETSGDIFDNDARMADDTLKKDSDLYQFVALMEQYGKELL